MKYHLPSRHLTPTAPLLTLTSTNKYSTWLDWIKLPSPPMFNTPGFARYFDTSPELLACGQKKPFLGSISHILAYPSRPYSCCLFPSAQLKNHHLGEHLRSAFLSSWLPASHRRRQRSCNQYGNEKKVHLLEVLCLTDCQKISVAKVLLVQRQHQGFYEENWKGGCHE